MAGLDDADYEKFLKGNEAENKVADGLKWHDIMSSIDKDASRFQSQVDDRSGNLNIAAGVFGAAAFGLANLPRTELRITAGVALAAAIELAGTAHRAETLEKSVYRNYISSDSGRLNVAAGQTGGAFAGSNVTALDGSHVIAHAGSNVIAEAGSFVDTSTRDNGGILSFVLNDTPKANITAQKDSVIDAANAVIDARAGSNVIAREGSVVTAEAGSKVWARAGSLVTAAQGAEVISDSGAAVRQDSYAGSEPPDRTQYGSASSVGTVLTEAGKMWKPGSAAKTTKGFSWLSSGTDINAPYYTSHSLGEMLDTKSKVEELWARPTK